MISLQYLGKSHLQTNITYSSRLQKALAIWDWNWSKLNFNSLQTKNLYQSGKGEKQRILKYLILEIVGKIISYFTLKK